MYRLRKLFGILGGVIMALATLLPWKTLSTGSFGTYPNLSSSYATYNLWSMYSGQSYSLLGVGFVIAGLGIVALVLWDHKKGWGLAMILALLVAAFLSALLVLAIGRSAADIGVWVELLGALLVIAAGTSVVREKVDSSLA